MYLNILDWVNGWLKKALGCNTDDWRMLNSCPACFYKLEGEPVLDIDWLVSINGNNSLKRWDMSTYGVSLRVDTCHTCSDYWLDSKYVDCFKYEGHSKVWSHSPLAYCWSVHWWQSNHDNDTDNWQNPPANTDPDMPCTAFTCVEHWRNAGPDQRKKMFSMFAESGIFIASCRHRFVLLACNMIRSGELYIVPFTWLSLYWCTLSSAKYPLAILSKLLSVYGKNGGCAYDIGCAFSIHSTSRVQATQKAKDVSMSLLHPMSLQGVLNMLHHSTVTKPLNNISPFGMLTNMLP